MNEVTGSSEVPGVERFVEIVVKGCHLLIMEIDSKVDFIS
jgi:hypothetical protein